MSEKASRGPNHWRWKGGPKKSRCVDCGAEITYGYTRCKSCAIKGERNPMWNGGIGNEPYPLEFNVELKLKIRTRDHFTCQLCGMIEEESQKMWGEVLSINHIDYDKQNCEENNLITLCRFCNNKVNSNRDGWQLFFEQLIREKEEISGVRSEAR